MSAYYAAGSPGQTPATGQSAPVLVSFAGPAPQSRVTVLFRVFLLIPCQIVQVVTGYGALTVFQFVSWLIVLVKGQLPETIYQAMSAVLRYQVRVIGFAVMLTSAYPAGLFGDIDRSWPYGQPQPGYGVQPGYGWQAGDFSSSSSARSSRWGSAWSTRYRPSTASAR